MNIMPIENPGAEKPLETISVRLKTNQPSIAEPSRSAPPAVTEEAQPEDQLSSKYAEFAKREKVYRRKVQAQQQALKQREDALKAKEQEYASGYIPKSQIPERFKKDPYQAMRDFGLTGDELTQALLNQPSPQDQTIQALKGELAELKNALSQTKTSIEEGHSRSREQAITQIRADVKSLVASDSNFDIIKNTGSEDAVVEYIEKKFERDGTIASIEEAAQAVEAELTEELMKYAQLKKIQEKLKSLTSPIAAETKELPPSQKSPVKTLAHSQVSTASRSMSPRERAIALLEGKL